MKIASNSFADNGRIPGALAFAVADPAAHIKLSSNRNPHLQWSGAPPGTKAFAVICHDRDVPSRADDVNKEGRVVSKALPRVHFYHWVLIDLPPAVTEIREGEFSDGVTPRGKKGPDAAHGSRQGINDYTAWFKGDKDMAGDYFGYDGPCPPWNDELLHHYVFTVCALDCAKLALQGKFTGAEALAAMEGHILDRASLTGIYTLNPAL
ncbi:MAG: YbhB/YbcL family Raf kinase inhibitor-like protein [Betaproteobacteria bacterium]|nr:YbhB/YbcL family Raf kinase inhibitor-like protein [Betaproteobacteria bacterium]MBI2961721.1 YbhB/YbcL family Raf kinase inhibitor-like protein [Betaproteobacteria bacterium]